MIELKKEKIGDKDYINLHDQIYEIEGEPRGIRDKFWIKRLPSRFLPEEKKNIHLLFKYNRNSKSCEDWGEVFASHIGKRVNVPVVEYYNAEYDNGVSKSKGVVCGSYLERDKQYEMSAHELQTTYSSFVHRPESNFINKEINTVYSMLDDVKFITPELSEDDEKNMLNKLKTDLLKQCLFDYLLAQTDRHWLNTTFLVYENGDKFFMKKAAAYDNGCIAFLKRKQSAIKGMSREIGINPLNSPKMMELMDKYVPMMGVKSSTVDLVKSHTGEDNIKLKVDLSKKDKFLDELTDEILTNPDLAVFYTLFKRDFNMNKVVDSIRAEGDEPPEEVVKMINDVVTYQINTLEVILNKKLAKIRKEWREGDMFYE